MTKIVAKCLEGHKIMKKILTGIKPTGVHLGNWIGAIKPSLEMVNENSKTLVTNSKGYFFLADYHALNSMFDPVKLSETVQEVAATWLALGLDPKKSVFYRQSDIPEITELATILAAFTSKGLLNRAHAYKAIQDRNQEEGKKDLDDGVNMGLYTYPLLMTADILAFNADLVPVGEDNTQHLEIARDIAGRFNRNYKTETLKLPELVVRKGAMLSGLDGRKMSASYNNHIPVFTPEKKLRKLIMKITTDSTPPEEPKEKDANTLFSFYSHFASPDQISQMEKKYQTGIAWGEVKQEIYEVLSEELKDKREIYEHYKSSKEDLMKIFKKGAEEARETTIEVLNEVKKTIGISF